MYIKYFYSRPIEGKILIKNPITEETHMWNSSKFFRRFTMCAVYDDESKTISFGVAICDETDQFNKRIGQSIAVRRAMSTPFYVIENFNGKRNDYADEVRSRFISMEKKLLKKYYPFFKF